MEASIDDGRIWKGPLPCPVQAHRHLDPQYLCGAPQRAVLELVELIGAVFGLAELENISPGIEQVFRPCQQIRKSK